MSYTKHKRIVPLRQERKYIEQAPSGVPYYSRPASAADIWFDGESLVLGFPPSADHVRGHTVKIPATPQGQVAIIDCLKARAVNGPKHNFIGEKGAITGYQLEQILRAMGTGAVPKYDAKGTRQTTLADLGLD